MAEADFFPLIAAVMVFASFALFFTAIYFYSRWVAERRRLIERIETEPIGFTLKEAGGKTAGNEPANYLRAILGVFRRVGKIVRADEKADAKEKRLAFLRAGIRSENMPLVFWGAKYVMGVLFPAVFIFSRPLFLNPMKPSVTLVLSLCLVMAGFYIPDLWLKLKTSRRKKEIRDALPDALDLLVVCVEAGMGLDAAMHRVGEEVRIASPAISDEFRLFNLEVRAGKAKRDALKNLSLRTDHEDVNSLVTLLIQTEKFGTSIAHSLRVYSDSFRTKRAQRAEEIAAKLPVKILLPLALFIFPSMFIAILGPGAIRIFRLFLGSVAK
ncbi:MAG: type II secretion system F family protein [Syntrophobacteraceae bacterium]|jgi:tight adherence protein C